MIFRVTLKDPDSLYDAINDAIDNLDYEELSDDELDAVKEKRREAINQMACDNWFEWGEYLTVEIDTEEKTCVVIPNK